MSDVRGSNTVLVMTSSSRSSALVSEFLSEMDVDAPKGQRGRTMMEAKLRQYLFWKGKLASQKGDGKNQSHGAVQSTRSAPKPSDSSAAGNSKTLSEALKRKDTVRQERSANRRRVRGGGPSTALRNPQPDPKPEVIVIDDDEDIAGL